MKIQGLEGAICFRASVLVKKYGISIEKARSLKTGETVDVAADKARRLIEDRLADPVDTFVDESIVTTSDDVDKTEDI